MSLLILDTICPTCFDDIQPLRRVAICTIRNMPQRPLQIPEESFNSYGGKRCAILQAASTFSLEGQRHSLKISALITAKKGAADDWFFNRLLSKYSISGKATFYHLLPWPIQSSFHDITSTPPCPVTFVVAEKLII